SVPQAGLQAALFERFFSACQRPAASAPIFPVRRAAESIPFRLLPRRGTFCPRTSRLAPLPSERSPCVAPPNSVVWLGPDYLPGRGVSLCMERGEACPKQPSPMFLCQFRLNSESCSPSLCSSAQL